MQQRAARQILKKAMSVICAIVVLRSVLFVVNTEQSTAGVWFRHVVPRFISEPRGRYSSRSWTAFVSDSGWRLTSFDPEASGRKPDSGYHVHSKLRWQDSGFWAPTRRAFRFSIHFEEFGASQPSATLEENSALQYQIVTDLKQNYPDDFKYSGAISSALEGRSRTEVALVRGYLHNVGVVLALAGFVMTIRVWMRTKDTLGQPSSVL